VTPLNIIYNSISRRVLTCRSFLQRVSDIAPDVFRAVVSPPCQRLELHYRTNRSPPKAANELVRIRRARRLESKTRISLVNLGMICQRFETVRHFPHGVRLKSSIPPSSLLSEFGAVHKSRFIFRRLCVPTYVHPSTFVQGTSGSPVSLESGKWDYLILLFHHRNQPWKLNIPRYRKACSLAAS